MILLPRGHLIMSGISFGSFNLGVPLTSIRWRPGMMLTISQCVVQSMSRKNYLVPNVESDEYEKYWIIGIYKNITDGKIEE